MAEQSFDESTEAFIELMELDDETSQDPAVIRKSFRVPVPDKENYLLMIQGTPFPIEDINAQGAGIVMDKDLSFVKGMTLSGCELILNHERFSDVACEIAHITSIEGRLPVFGVKWLKIHSADGKDEVKRLINACALLKKKLLSDDNTSVKDSDNNKAINEA